MQRLFALLAAHRVDYQVLHHPPVHTSQEAALIRGTPVTMGAKALLFQADDHKILLVTQAHRRIETRRFKRQHHIRDLYMLSPELLLEHYGLEIGAVPPFGSLLNVPTYADDRLFALPKIVFNAGSRSTSVILATSDYQHIEHPIAERLASDDTRDSGVTGLYGATQ
jgi:prolyl-tRNA editing enzyme YbaK/EbsC (Cys-tRNA(Pro) deacylase)